MADAVLDVRDVVPLCCTVVNDKMEQPGRGLVGDFHNALTFTLLGLQNATLRWA